jgi:membrane-bound serine protease (ClpP class)
MQPPKRAHDLAARYGRMLFVAGLAWMLATAGDGADPASGSAATIGDPTAPVYVLTATGVVDNVLAGYIEEGVQRAVESSSPAIIITLNTPGGSLDATQRIVSTILEAPLPTIVYVAPSGGRAASAGTFITLAANLAYMAPGTNIGAASPVAAGGEDIEGTIGDKVRNDAIANIRSIAEARGRDIDWAVSTVAQAVSSSALEAVAIGAVDGIAVSLDDVRRQANGQVVDVVAQEVEVDIADAPFVDLPMNPFQSLLHLLSDPNIAFILLTLGFYGLIFELQSPNFVTGILGAIALVLAFIAFGNLPLNIAGLLLIGLAVILFLLEFTVTSHGLLAVGGIVCFVLGASALYTAPGNPTAPDVSVAVPLIVVMTAITAGFVIAVLIAVVRVRRRGLAYAGAYGAGGSSTVPVGSAAVVKTALDPRGVVAAAGEEWSARSADGSPVVAGAHVRVVGQEGLTLVVGPAGPTGEETTSTSQEAP